MANVTFTFNPTPAPACYPSDVNGLAQELTTGGILVGTIPDTAGGGVFVGQTQPPSANTNKVWFRTDAAGRPTGVFMFYNGNWRKVYTGIAIGEIRMILFYTGYFDSSGRGTVGGEYDGWAVCNGQNGTPNLEGYFPVPGVQGEYVSQPAGQWYTQAEGGPGWKNTGGQRARVVITTPQTPPLITQLYSLFINYGGGPNGLSVLLGAPTGNAQIGDYPAKDASDLSTGLRQPIPFQNLYVALGFLMFVGYL